MSLPTEAVASTRQRAWLVLLGCVWLVVGPSALLGAVAYSDWPPIPELPTAAQVQAARENALAAAAVAVLLPAVGLLLARRWRQDLATALFLVATMAAVLVSGLLLSLTSSPVRAPGPDCPESSVAADC
jgi:hypothetical protein